MATELRLRMTIKEFSWEPKVNVDPKDQALIDAYLSVKTPLDALAYTDEFKSLAKQAGFEPENDKDLRFAYRRLLSFRKKGILPRIYSSSSSGDE